MENTIALFGSSRRDGNTGRLIDRVAIEFGFETIDLSQYRISPYDYLQNNRGDDFESLFKHVLGFENIIFSSPVYWYAVSPPMKIFLDRISDFLTIPELIPNGRQLRGKNAFIVCTSIEKEASAPFVDAFKHTFDYLGMRYGGCLHANCKDGYSAQNYEQDVKTFIRQSPFRRSAALSL